MEELRELEETKKLTPKQEKFCQEYVGCLLGYAAYQKAYPDSKYNTARTESSKLLANPNIKARIEELQQEQAERYKISAGFLIEKSLEVYNKASAGKEEVVVDKFGEIVKTGNKIYDTRGMNDALKNIASFTGLNVQTIKAQVDAKAEANVKVVTADDVASKILGDDIDA